ncbi:unnamed protein product [Rotaria sordida]|uniref:Uncharacterized protein n=1 Tax=Rotaria sordida TaxID=392033 RepID=A0A814PM41_9BILA|nr:unnamed protein product [Rotaria sordida]
MEMIIYASSIMTVFGYLENEPYSSLAKTIQPKQLLKKITINDPPISSHFNPSFGWINTTYDVTSDLYDWSGKSVWCSHRDLCQFIDRILEKQSILNKFEIYFVSSNNDYCWINMDNCQQDLDYIPQDGTKCKTP